MDLNLQQVTFIKILDGNVLTSSFVDGVAARVVAISASEYVLNPPVQIEGRLVSDTDPGGLDGGSVGSKR